MNLFNKIFSSLNLIISVYTVIELFLYSIDASPSAQGWAEAFTIMTLFITMINGINLAYSFRSTEHISKTILNIILLIGNLWWHTSIL